MGPRESVVVYRVVGGESKSSIESFDEQTGHSDSPGHLDEGGGSDSHQFLVHYIYAKRCTIFLGPVEKDPAAWTAEIFRDGE